MRDLIHKLPWCTGAQVPNNTVVCKYLHLALREYHSKEIVVFLKTCVTGIGLFPSSCNDRSGRASVVTIGNIEEWCFCRKDFLNSVCDLFVGNNPEGVSDPVVSGKIVYRLLPAHRLLNSVKYGKVRIGKKHRPALGILGFNVADTVFFLFFSGKLVLFYHIVVVIFCRNCSHETCLRVITHDLPIEVETGFAILRHQAVLHEPAEVPCPLLVNLIAVQINFRGKINLRLYHPEKTQWIVLHQIPCLPGIEHIVRW